MFLLIDSFMKDWNALFQANVTGASLYKQLGGKGSIIYLPNQSVNQSINCYAIQIYLFYSSITMLALTMKFPVCCSPSDKTDIMNVIDIHISLFI